MKSLLVLNVAAVLLVGCGRPSAPDGIIHGAVLRGNTEDVKQFIAAGTDVNAKAGGGDTPLDWAIMGKRTGAADLLRKHGGKTGEKLTAEGK